MEEYQDLASIPVSKDKNNQERKTELWGTSFLKTKNKDMIVHTVMIRKYWKGMETKLINHR